MKKITALSLVLTLIAQASVACTTIIVGKNVSADGSILVARSVDGIDGVTSIDHVYHPPRDKGSVVKSTIEGHFTYKLPDHLLGYTGDPVFPTLVHSDTVFEESGFNDVGVGVSATETIFSNDATLKVDPYKKEGGVVEEVIPTVILPQVKTAREGVLLLGHLIEQLGAAEGVGVAIVDKNEAWYLENAGGHEWLAQRIPDDSYFVSANQSRLGSVDFNDTANVLSSPNLEQWAADHGLFDPKNGKAFNFREVFSRDDPKLDVGYNYARVSYLQGSFTKALVGDWPKSNNFPTFAKPDRKISLADVEAALESHYQGTPHDPYTLADPSVTERPVSVFRTVQSHVLQTRTDLPPAIANVEYLSFGMAALGVYLPLYEGAAIPASLQGATNKADDLSAYWAFRRVQALALQNYPKYGPLVRQRFDALAADIATRQHAFEKQYADTYAQDPAKAKQLLDAFTNETVAQGVQVARDLSNEIVTDIAKDVEKKYHFEGA
ncbi:C69 family dipeptidase [Pararobbsia silviterrae]|uniref:Dipeptidase n=1 Tax=Pararobbsia silviterrae TaxID=1792498 RepID=A0A494XZK1_9BURK|nr:C69 family dipeptidase [Pararobbsia silviterrae]RKP53616.1 C69 family dipeptidase [Pararobbsia silviterrae]